MKTTLDGAVHKASMLRDANPTEKKALPVPGETAAKLPRFEPETVLELHPPDPRPQVVIHPSPMEQDRLEALQALLPIKSDGPPVCLSTTQTDSRVA